MPNRMTCSIALVLCATIFSTSIHTAAHGGVIGTQQYLSAVDREAAIARIDAVLAREEVRSRLEHYGVDPMAAQERVAALTDEELEADMSDEETRTGFRDIDTNDDGLIDFKEFVDWWVED